MFSNDLHMISGLNVIYRKKELIFDFYVKQWIKQKDLKL